MRLREGRYQHAQADLFGNENDDVVRPAGAVTDMSERAVAGQEIEAAARRHRVLADIGAAALGGTALSELMQMVASRVAAALDVESCEVLELLPGGEELLLRAGAGCNTALVGKATVGSQSASVPGFTLANQGPVVVEDLANDERFRGSRLLADNGAVSGISVVIGGAQQPFGVLGAYTRKPRRFTDDEAGFLQTAAGLLANAVALGRAQEMLLDNNRELERRFEDTTAELQGITEGFETFSAAISHDLRQPLHAVGGFVGLLQVESADQLDETARYYLSCARAGISKMSRMIDELLQLSRLQRTELKRSRVDLSDLARRIVEELRASAPDRRADVEVQQDLVAFADEALITVLMRNLLGNAWKFTSRLQDARIKFSTTRNPAGTTAYFVRDNGSGFDMKDASRLFLPFQRLHSEEELSGTGMGLATVACIAKRHGGRVWADGAVDNGATFYFSLGLRTDSFQAVPVADSRNTGQATHAIPDAGGKTAGP